MSWDLKVGEIKSQYITDDIIWMNLNNFFYASNMTTSYKYGFFKALLENLYQVNENFELDYDRIFYSFTKIYWNLCIHHSLWQSNSKKQPSKIQKVLEMYTEKYQIPREWKFDQLPNQLQLEIIRDVKTYGKRYVIGAFYGDMGEVVYKFDLKNEYLKFNKPFYIFFQRFQRPLTNMANYQLAKYLEKYNEVPHVDYLLSKVEVISKRNSLKEYFDILISHDKQTCFYCKKPLIERARKIHVDHFIPWSFIQSDDLWNLVLTCQKCNVNKSNYIAEPKYLNLVIERNESLCVVGEVVSTYFYSYQPTKLKELYNYSLTNGFKKNWKPM